MERAIVVVNPMKGGDICGPAVGKACLYFCMCGPFVVLSYTPFITKYVPGLGCAAKIFPDMFCHFLISTIAISEVPLTLIFVCNLTIIIFLKRQNMKVHSEKRNKKFKRATNMWLFLDFFLLSSCLPNEAVISHEVVVSREAVFVFQNEVISHERVSDDVTDVLLDLNYAINFYLYVITGKSMRREIRSLFGCLGNRESTDVVSNVI
ncbi:unnamed protein product [Candidula unifasciata]|uniref:Uncharacterized protein n=1 Tax=Candidula unifasciata TaxID=100452 RepID=A0A8S3ZV89_9EUPU|nr:unnamed protein product [Candidula unifasciata]